MRFVRMAWVTAAALVFIPANLRRGYSLRDQAALARIARRIEGRA